MSEMIDVTVMSVMVILGEWLKSLGLEAKWVQLILMVLCIGSVTILNWSTFEYTTILKGIATGLASMGFYDMTIKKFNDKKEEEYY